MTERIEPPAGNAWDVDALHKVMRQIDAAITILECADYMTPTMKSDFDDILREIDRQVAEMQNANRNGC